MSYLDFLFYFTIILALITSYLAFEKFKHKELKK